jgi:hypothetical protein
LACCPKISRYVNLRPSLHLNFLTVSKGIDFRGGWNVSWCSSRLLFRADVCVRTAPYHWRSRISRYARGKLWWWA